MWQTVLQIFWKKLNNKFDDVVQNGLAYITASSAWLSRILNSQFEEAMINTKKKKILFVAFPGSIHTARWIAQLNGQGWDVHLFPSLGGEAVHPNMANVTVHHLFYSERLSSGRFQNPVAPSRLAQRIDSIRTHIIERRFPMQRAKQLARVINRLQPDIIHSLEIQAAGYLTLAAKELYKGKFPSWIVTNWGSDIFLFGRLQQHKKKIGEVLAGCDYYSCECHRDAKLARDHGFEKTVLPVFPNTGGFDLKMLEGPRNARRTSERKLIMLKGYQNWAGRALVGLRALERCADLLADYTVVIYSAYPEVVISAELFSDKTGILTRIIPLNTSHSEMLALHGQARISMGLSISDAISTSLLEAMVMGSFPIQSCTACADEWIQHGVGGMIVPPEDPDIIEMAIRVALTDDALVNKAATINWQTVHERLDATLLKQQAVCMYQRLLQCD